MNVEQISAQEVASIIEEVGGDVEVLRSGKNEFNEPIGEEPIANVKGYFYKEDNTKRMTIDIGGMAVMSDKTDCRLLTWVNTESLKIQVNDFFYYCNEKYKIIDLGRFENTYFNMSLEVVK